MLIIANPKFPLGQTVITANALWQINQIDMAGSVQRHASGDWGWRQSGRSNLDTRRLPRLSLVRAVSGAKTCYENLTLIKNEEFMKEL